MAPIVSSSQITAQADLILFALLGLFGGAHCLGMCGPLVSTYADRIDSHTDTNARVTPFDVRQHTLFNLGRTGAYAVVGGILGLMGGFLVTGTTTVFQSADVIRGGMGVVTGIIILAIGVGYLGRGTTPSFLAVLPGLGGVVGRVSTRLNRLATSTGIVGLGAVHALFPCPILYPAYLYAFASGDPLRGSLALALVGLGTLPTVLAYGLAFGSIGIGHRRVLHRGMGVAFLALGYIPLSHGLTLLGIDVPRVPIPVYRPL